MMKKTLVGVGLAAAVMLPSGLAIAQPLQGSDNGTAISAADQTRTRDQLHTPGDCDFDGEGAVWADGTGEGEQKRLRTRLHQDGTNQTRTEAHEFGPRVGDADRFEFRQGPNRS